MGSARGSVERKFGYSDSAHTGPMAVHLIVKRMLGGESGLYVDFMFSASKKAYTNLIVKLK